MWLDHLLDLLGPRECAACGAETADGAFCRACSGTLSTIVESLSGLTITTLGCYESAAGEAARRLKYEGRPELGVPLGRCLASKIRGQRGPAPILVPVPLHRDRLRQRGFNQAALLAHGIARETGWKVRHLLTRDSAGTDQAGSSRARREAQVRGRYACARQASRPYEVFLVDDVVTTGSTLSACQGVLESAGWTTAGAVAIARAQIR